MQLHEMELELVASVLLTHPIRVAAGSVPRMTDARDPLETTDDGVDMTFSERRHDELTRASGSTEADAAPRITTEDRGDGMTRIDVADTAAVRPGGVDTED